MRLEGQHSNVAQAAGRRVRASVQRCFAREATESRNAKFGESLFVTVAQCKTATVRVYKGKDYKYAKMSTGKARRGAVAQWATPFMGP